MNKSLIVRLSTTINHQLTFIEQVDAIIQQNLSNESFSIADLEKELYLSSSQIYRKIRLVTGCSPSIYVRNIRLQYAYNLIGQSDLSLSEIAYLTGFSCLSYFSRCFSKKYGFPPSQLRNLASA